MDIESLKKIFIEHVDYDATAVSEEIKCQKCSHIVRPLVLNHFLYHVGVLSSHLFSALKLPERYRTDFDEWFHDSHFYVSGDKAKDAQEICEEVLREWGSRE